MLSTKINEPLKKKKSREAGRVIDLTKSHNVLQVAVERALGVIVYVCLFPSLVILDGAF